LVNDARTNTKTYLDSYLDSSNLKADDESQSLFFAVIFSNPDYPLTDEFTASDVYVDLLFCLGESNSTPMIGFNHYIYGYNEEVPIQIWTLDKTGITGTKVLWKAEAELRRIVETYPFGSLRSLIRKRGLTQRVGQVLYGTEFVLRYQRDTT
jgi:hypothetical protein